ncbi:MAG: prepilin-type N-terminal cleavage/methylation domain-containing protein [Nitrospiraceae bacterium]|nr:MAG: prepilin-type N-terminal cleavage/methylation domain-containing protein [Nitrospiraceae bacterium]
MKENHTRHMSPRRHDHGQARGFTLLEIMIALAIIGIALTAVIHTVNYHTSIMYENIQTTRMYQAAKEKMAELEMTPRNGKGSLEIPGMEYENTVTPLEDTSLAELRTVVTGFGRQVVLNELVPIKPGFTQ